jgi:hypothetical protein
VKTKQKKNQHISILSKIRQIKMAKHIQLYIYIYISLSLTYYINSDVFLFSFSRQKKGEDGEKKKENILPSAYQSIVSLCGGFAN